MNALLNSVTKLAVPAAIGISLLQASLYDVKGGTRAVIFDRMAGVKNEVHLPNRSIWLLNIRILTVLI